MKIGKTIGLILLSFAAIPVVSQETEKDAIISDFKFKIFAGIRNIECDSFGIDKNLDFVNAYYSEYDYIEYQYLGLNFGIKAWQKIELNLDLLVVDSYVLNNLQAHLCYMPFKNLGFSTGYYSFDYFMNDYDYFYRIIYPDYYIYHDDNFYQKRIKDYGFLFGPVFRVHPKRFFVELRMNSGFLTTKMFVEEFAMKQKNSNFRQLLRLETHKAWTPLFYPEIKLEYNFLKKTDFNMGLNCRASYFIQDKYLDYTLIRYEWTRENSTEEIWFNPHHKFEKLEIDLGLLFSW
ncbi:MAG: hypothetical protein JXA77_09500 [Bacteroidales bacterium]|nr:hypothetical protein [Bacteroidales bacterium]MBN2817404.1 hypothetical protein [Bacteroidales bacterium]